MLLVVDQAGWHQSQELVIPEGIDLFELPSHSPELQPAERLWSLTNEAVANCSPKNLSELEELLIYRCQQLLGQQDLIRGLTCFHWWPPIRRPLTITRVRGTRFEQLWSGRAPAFKFERTTAFEVSPILQGVNNLDFPKRGSDQFFARGIFWNPVDHCDTGLTDYQWDFASLARL